MQFSTSLKTLICGALAVQLFGACSSKDDVADNSNTAADSVAAVPTTFACDTSKFYSLEIATAEEFARAKKNFVDPYLYDTTLYRKKNDTIALPVENEVQPFVYITDTLSNGDDDAMRTNYYVGSLPGVDAFLVITGYYEDMEAKLVDKKSGKITACWNKPYPSPNKKYLACQSPSYGMEGLPNGLQFWKLPNADEPAQLLYEINQEAWVPYDFYWVDNKTLLVEVNSVENYLKASGPDDKKGVSYLRLKLK